MAEGTAVEPYYSESGITIFNGDCRAVLATMEAGSFDCCVCDPPYGLEFMGKEWDRLDGGLPQENVWKGRRGKGGSGIAPMTHNGGTFKDFKAAPSYGGNRAGFKRCVKCGKRAFSGSPCQCEEPEFVIEYPDGAPSSLIRMQRWHEAWLREAYRVLKPGGVLMAFGGTRTWHRLACAVEDAGFVIFDTLMWLHGQGFPKHKTLLKPAFEPIIVAKKPGPGGLHTEAARIGGVVPQTIQGRSSRIYGGGDGFAPNGQRESQPSDLGRWPPNIALSHIPPGPDGTGGCTRIGDRRVKANRWGKDPLINCEASIGFGGSDVAFQTRAHHDPDGLETVESWDCQPGCPIFTLDRQAGERRSSHGGGHRLNGSSLYGIPADDGGQSRQYFDQGGASRFFKTCGWEDGETRLRYCSKAPRSERTTGPNGERHPTQKPLALMRWLVALACPPGGLLVDPFMGSGTTLVAARALGVRAIGIDSDESSCAIAAKRLAKTVAQLDLAAAV